MKILAAAQSGFSPQLMRSVIILRMNARSLMQFLSQHNNPCLQTAHPPPLAETEEADIRALMKMRYAESPAPPAIREQVKWLIECIDDDGFLEPPDDPALAEGLLARAVDYLQHIAPPGIAARSAQERLLLLLKQTPPCPLRDRAEMLITRQWQWLQRKRWDKLPQRQLQAALALIDALPAVNLPARAAAPSVPDAALAKQRGVWRAAEAAGTQISAYRAKSDIATATDWRLAGELLAAVKSRRRWIIRAAQYAADHQSAFLTRGAAALRPLPLKTAAHDLKISVPMLSHILHEKRVIFSAGEFPLKYLFGAHTGSTVIQHTIQTLLAHEDPHHPLSDERLRRLLFERGIFLARRTVTKHRAAAGFFSIARRKRPRH